MQATFPTLVTLGNLTAFYTGRTRFLCALAGRVHEHHRGKRDAVWRPFTYFEATRGYVGKNGSRTWRSFRTASKIAGTACGTATKHPKLAGPPRPLPIRSSQRQATRVLFPLFDPRMLAPSAPSALHPVIDNGSKWLIRATLTPPRCSTKRCSTPTSTDLGPIFLLSRRHWTVQCSTPKRARVNPKPIPGPPLSSEPG